MKNDDEFVKHQYETILKISNTQEVSLLIKIPVFISIWVLMIMLIKLMLLIP